MPLPRTLCSAVLVWIVAAAGLRAQSPADSTARPDSLRRSLSIPRLALIGGITAGGFVYGHILQNDLWWKGERSDFHFDWDHDWTYALGADKLGHFYFPYLTTNIYRQAFTWAGMDTSSALWAAGGLAFTYQTYIEVRDGFSAAWGFSWGDFAANTLGALYPVAQYHLPPLRNFDVRISFYPSEKFRNGAYGAIIDDYESTFHWLTVNVHDLLPENLRGDYPAWLNIAVGHSVRGLDLKGAGGHELFLSLDWNLEGLPGDGWFWKLLKENLKFYHLPAPAVKIYPGVVWYGVHF